MSTFLHVEVPADCIAAARRGERSAQHALYVALAGPVHTLLRRIVVRPAIAEELLHEVFLEVLRSLDGWRGNGPFAGWVRAIAVRRALMHLRSPTQAPPVAHDGAALADEVAPASDDRQDEIERALNALPPVARAVVWLHDVEGYTHAEIGRLHGQSASYSKSQLARAHALLRARLEPLAGETPCTLASTG